jgi:two-component system sensor histidine kinase CpxA
MRPFRSLFARVFLWFWATLVAGSLVVLLVTLATGTQPFGARWMHLTQDLYARSALDFYDTNGPAGLQKYLAHLRDASSMHGALLDAKGRDILTGEDRSGLPIVRRAIASNSSRLEPGRIWRAASVIDDHGRRYIFLNEVYPMGRFVDGTFAKPVLWRLLLVIAIAGLCSFLLARSIVRPIQALQHGALAVAEGNLATRVMPAIGTTHAELADTASAFDQMAERLEEMHRRREQLLADMSHELRSPLTRMSVSLELARRGQTDVIDRMDADLERMNQMIGQILLLARMQSDAGRWNAAPVAIAPLLESIANDAMLEGQPEDKTVALDIAADAAGINVMGDVDLLRSCVENIVRNALRYSPTGGVIELRCRLTALRLAPAVEIRIDDHGPGVPHETLPYLFDPFYRISSSRTPGPGAHVGLGMSIAERAVQVHGGGITAANRIGGNGLCVTITLPLRPGRKA